MDNFIAGFEKSASGKSGYMKNLLRQGGRKAKEVVDDIPYWKQPLNTSARKIKPDKNKTWVKGEGMQAQLA